MLTDNEHLLSLSPVTECTFCDTDWLRERRSQLDHTEAVTFVHPSISNELAEQLGVPSLVNRFVIILVNSDHTRWNAHPLNVVPVISCMRFSPFFL